MNDKKTSIAAIIALIASACPFVGVGIIMAYKSQSMPPAWAHTLAGCLVVFGSLIGVISSVVAAISISISKRSRKGWVLTLVAFILSCFGISIIPAFPWGGYD